MTKHTDTSRSGDLVERLRSHDYDHAYNLKTDEELYAERDEAADRIEALEAEVERLRGVLRYYTDKDDYGERARAALEKKQ